MNKVTALSLLSNACSCGTRSGFIEVEATTGDTVAGADRSRRATRARHAERNRSISQGCAVLRVTFHS
jgi:hypothetical protein